MERITLYDVNAQEYNIKLAEALKKTKDFQVPEWAFFVKSGASKERPPLEEDFWYKRVASILRQVYIKGIIGVSRLRTRYGGRKDRGSRPPEFRKSGGKIIRVILQQAEKAEFLKKSEGKKKGRELTKKGLEFMNKVAEEIKKGEEEK